MRCAIVTVRDKKTGLYGKPSFVEHTAEVVREWDVIRKDPNTKIGKHPEDFDLFQVATFNDETGEVTQLNPHIHLATGV